MRLLLVEDDPLVAKAIAAALRPAAVVIATTLARARPLSLEPFDGYLFDVHLPDGSGLELACAVRARDGRAPLLVITGDDDPHIAERCARAWLFLSAKRDLAAALPRFAAACQAAPHTPAPARRAVDARSRRPRAEPAESSTQRSPKAALTAYASARGLSAREITIVDLAMRGTRREEVARELGISLKTYDNHVNRILAKCARERIHEVATGVWLLYTQADEAAPGEEESR